jgi:hypothetical protein
MSKVGQWIGTQWTWFKLIFADDDERASVHDAPTMKNFILFILLILFCIAYIKVIYLTEFTVKADIKDPNKTTVVVQVPDIPSGWSTVFMVGLGAMAALSGAKKIAEFKYTATNGAGDGMPDEKTKTP